MASQRYTINRVNLSAMLASTKTRLLIISRYKGSMVMDIVTPIVLAMVPILLGAFYRRRPGRAGVCSQYRHR